MADYVLVVDSIENLSDIEARVASSFGDYRPIAENAFVIRSKSTTSQGISEKIFGESQGEDRVERHAVFRFTAYWGFHDRDLWEWLDTPEADG